LLAKAAVTQPVARSPCLGEMMNPRDIRRKRAGLFRRPIHQALAHPTFW
jgi:hypothetical protein